ncbi:ComF family protein [Acetobacter sp. TBRC 12305]|uniref:ComF family protein n=1 Tax=Acetobacter garciniae TaxID=2817435 RepID=A0A939HNB5_9PROT|nr:ComF family protein [Acetobacter garciniae]MBO1324109.1 ComF family protein [Acetobacter garciniae]MBX0343798.1 ComF family protein [Acetobacter garciniae]
MRGTIMGRMGRAALDMLYPPSCLLCGTDVAQAGLVCTQCFGRLQPVSQPFCKACAAPQASAALLGPQGLCKACERHHPVWGQARAAFVYGGGTRELILQLKYADRLDNAAYLGARMVAVGADILQPGSLLVPVPVHRWRLLARRYNQAALLARVVARLSGLDHMPDALVRRRPTARLARFSRAARQKEVSQAVGVRASRRDLLAGRQVVLVDDMLTSGATASACARALREAGVQNVHVLVAGVVPARADVDIELSDMNKTRA